MPTQSGLVGQTRPHFTFLLSSMVEHAAVNRRVVGSSPTGGANPKSRRYAVIRVAALLLDRLWAFSSVG